MNHARVASENRSSADTPSSVHGGTTVRRRAADRRGDARADWVACAVPSTSPSTTTSGDRPRSGRRRRRPLPRASGRRTGIVAREVWLEGRRAGPARDGRAGGVRRRRRRATSATTRSSTRRWAARRQRHRASALQNDIVVPYLRDLRHRGAEAAVAARLRSRRADHRHRDDRARRRHRPAGHPRPPARPRRRPLRRQRRRRPSSPTASSPTWSSSSRKTDPDAPGAKGISLLVRGARTCRASAAAASWTRSACRRQDTAELFFDDVAGAGREPAAARRTRASTT